MKQNVVMYSVSNEYILIDRTFSLIVCQYDRYVILSYYVVLLVKGM